MKKLLNIFLIFLIFLSAVFFTFASGIFQIKNVSTDNLGFEIYAFFKSSNDEPIFSLSEIDHEIDKIPEALKPLMKKILFLTPRPKNGIHFQIFSKTYIVVFKNEKDWKLFKKTLVKILDHNSVIKNEKKLLTKN